MELLSAAAWLSGLFFFTLAIWLLVRQRAVCGVASLSLLGMLVLLRPIMFVLDLDTARPPGAFRHLDLSITLTILAFAAWVLCYLLGYLTLRPISTVLSAAFPKPPPTIPAGALLKLALFFTIAGGFGTAIVVSPYPSFGAFMFAVKVDKALAGLYVIRELTTLASIICLIGVLHHLKERQRARRMVSLNRDRRTGRIADAILVRSRRQIVILLALALLNLSANYVWGNRANIAFFLLAATISYHFYIRRLGIGSVVLLVLAAAIGFEVLAVLRANLITASIGRESFINQMTFWQSLSNSLHLSEFDALSLAIQDAGTRFPFQQGTDFYNGLVSWVPRQLWPGKPETYYIGRWFRQVYEPSMANGWPVTVIGSWYVNFAVPGIVFGGLFSGTLAAAIDRKYRRRADSSAFAAVLPITLGIFFMAGGYDTGTPQEYVLLVVPLFAVATVLKRAEWAAKRQPRVAPPPGMRPALSPAPTVHSRP